MHAEFKCPDCPLLYRDFFGNFSVYSLMHACTYYTGELNNIQIDARDFDAGSSNVLVISFTVNGLTAERSVTFTGEYAPILGYTLK